MSSLILDEKAASLLKSLYDEARVNDPKVRDKESGQSIKTGYYMRNAFMPVSPEFGKMLYSIIRTSKAKTIIEFGTSFGVSTIFLAAAVRDNGGGKVITNELHQEKSDRAKQNLAAAGLADFVEFRIGDARETLAKECPAEVDLLFLDGAKGLYLEVLKVVESRLRSGAIVAADNTEKEDLQDFLEYMRTPANGFVSSAFVTAKDTHTISHELSLKA